MDVLPKPDVIVGAFDTLRVQSQRIANVGAIQNQQNILAAVQALGQQIHALGQQTNHRIDVMQQQMNQRFDTLENRQNNFEIAAVNARLVHADGAVILQRPVDIRNGGDIPDFPLTHPQLYTVDGMSGSETTSPATHGPLAASSHTRYFFLAGSVLVAYPEQEVSRT